MRSYYVHFWDTTSWQLLSTTGPFQHGENGEYDNADFQLITDDIWIWGEQIFRAGTATPIAKLPGSSLRFLREVVLLDSGQLRNPDLAATATAEGPKISSRDHSLRRMGVLSRLRMTGGNFNSSTPRPKRLPSRDPSQASTRRGSDGWEDWSVPTTTIPKATCTACRHRINWTFHLTSSNLGPGRGPGSTRRRGRIRQVGRADLGEEAAGTRRQACSLPRLSFPRPCRGRSPALATAGIWECYRRR